MKCSESKLKLSLKRRGLLVCLALGGGLVSQACYFGEVTADFEVVSTLLEGQSFSNDELVLIEGQAMTLEYVVSRNGNEKTWKVIPIDPDSNVVDVHNATERNQFVVTGREPGNLEISFRVRDKRWYTRRKDRLQVTVLSRGDWEPSAESNGGAGGAGGAAP